MAKCKHKRPILVKVDICELEPDQEPYESGVLEAMDTIYCNVMLTGHYCADCETLLDIKIEHN